MSWIWEPWKSLITNFLSRSVLVKSVLRLNQNFICPPWIIIEPEKRRNFWSKLGWKGVWPLNGFCLQLKTKAVFLWGPLKNGMGEGGGGRGIHNFRICSFRYWGESQFRVDILPYKKKLYLWLSSSLSQFPRIFIYVLCQSLICLNLLFQGHIALQNYILTGPLQCFLNLLHILTNVIYYNYLYY